jgi:PglZ domain
MKIQEFIRDQFKKRLDSGGCLVVYDAEGCYRECAADLASDACAFIDAGESIIAGREQALNEWLKLARPGKSAKQQRQLVVYVPAPKPETDEDRCRDPFQIFALGGGVFPEGDGDSYQALCRRAKPDFAVQIEALFQAGVPDFRTVDNVGAGKGWPRLRTLLGVESAAEILVALLSPTAAQGEALDEDSSWQAEFRSFCGDVLDYTPKTKSQKWATLSSELWRFILFSEFAFDLPGELPVRLRDVPRAAKTFSTLVMAVCKNLRDSERHHVRYMEQAGHVAGELKLETAMQGIEDMGFLDTFAFEERCFLRVFVKAALAGELGKAQKLSIERRASIWVKHTDRQLAWTVAERALELMTKADDLATELESEGKGVTASFDFYTKRGFLLDTLQRSFEQAVADCYGSMDGLDDLIEAARQKYQSFAEALQAKFIGAVVSEGWPASGRGRSTEVFDRWVAPALKERGKRIAFFLVDALRYELGVELERQLSKEGACELTAVCAQLPTITRVGMAALMPEANENLRLTLEADKLVPMLKDRAVVVPNDRLDYVRSIYGDQCAMIDLDELLAMNVSPKKKPKLPDTVRLLLVKTTDIDELGEVNPAKARELMPRALKDIIAGLGKLRKLGFDDVVIATDHGFILLPGQEAGDTVAKPSGDWLQVKDRCLLGSGSTNPACVVFPRQEVGIRGDFESYAVPRSFGTFSRRVPYFHEGLSLQECVLPVIAVRLKKEATATPASIEVQISYKGGRTNQVTTRLPLIDVSVFAGDIFESNEMELRLEAWGKDPATGQERVVGEPASSEHVHPATGLVRVKPGQAIKVPIRLDEGFSGSFEVRAYDPETRVAYGEALRLKTNILE